MNTKKTPRILAVGPLPPPFSGTTVCFQTFCDEARKHPDKLHLEIINSAPKKLGRTPLFTTAHFATAQRVLREFLREIRHVDKVIIFGSNQFLSSMAIILLGVAKIAGKPSYIRSFGGSLDRYYAGLIPVWRWLLRLALRHSDGLIVETQLIYAQLSDVFGNKVHCVPNYRYMPGNDDGYPGVKRTDDKLRLIFLGHVREEKGIFVLLESLHTPPISRNGSIQCDIFGPIYRSISERFKAELVKTPNASYKGVLNPEDAIPTLCQYDALVLPTFYSGEGHPGVIVEAMIAGIPVITTAHRSIPELVQEGFNGLLVPPLDSRGLAQAIHKLDSNRLLLADMGKNNWEMRINYSATDVIPDILRIMGIDL